MLHKLRPPLRIWRSFFEGQSRNHAKKLDGPTPISSPPYEEELLAWSQKLADVTDGDGLELPKCCTPSL